MMFHALLSGMRDADYGKPGIRCLRLFEIESTFFRKIRDELLSLIAANPGSDVRQRDHVTHWTGPEGAVTQFSLLNVGGRLDDPSTDHLLTTRRKRFHWRASCPTLGDFIAAFPDAINFRANVLGSGARLAPHEEHITVRTRTGAVGIKARLHLPVDTNDAAEVMVDGRDYHLEESILYYVNNGCVHAASNPGPSPRIHLVWDVLVTEEACRTLFGEAPIPRVPGRRFLGQEREVEPRRESGIGDYRRRRRHVPESEAKEIQFFDPQ